jgi:hypothetical protein
VLRIALRAGLAVDRRPLVLLGKRGIIEDDRAAVFIAAQTQHSTAVMTDQKRILGFMALAAARTNSLHPLQPFSSETNNQAGVERSRFLATAQTIPQASPE